MLRQLKPSRLQNIIHAITTHVVAPEVGTTIDDVLRPEYWAHIATKLRRGDIIIAMPDCGTFRLELTVIDTASLSANVRELHRWEWDAEADKSNAVTAAYEARWISVAADAKYGIFRLSDGVCVKRAIVDKTAAIREAANFQESRAA